MFSSSRITGHQPCSPARCDFAQEVELCMEWRRGLRIASGLRNKRVLPRAFRAMITILSIAGLVAGAAQSANADSIGIDFELPLYHTGTVDHQPNTQIYPRIWSGQ